MNRSLGTSPEGRRTLGLILVLGATFGAVVGAAIGAASGDVGHWMAMTIPAGISVGLAAGAVFSKPDREPMSGAGTMQSMGLDDDAVPPRSPNPDRPSERRLPAA